MSRDGAKESRRRLENSLRDALGKTILAALDDPRVVEVMLNPDGNLFIERIGAGMEPARRAVRRIVEALAAAGAAADDAAATKG